MGNVLHPRVAYAILNKTARKEKASGFFVSDSITDARRNFGKISVHLAQSLSYLTFYFEYTPQVTDKKE
jgi:hypothetical protein